MNRHQIGKTLLILGALSGTLLAGLAWWAEIEASQYGFLRYTRDRMSALRCPVFIAPHETLMVRTRVTNKKADYRARFTVRITKSSPTTFETETERFRLNPGESRVVAWPIGPENIDMGHFIFVDVYQYGGYPNIPLQAQCGVYVLPFDLPGNLVLWGGLAITLALLWGGWLLWRRGLVSHEANSATTRALDLLAITVPLSMVVAFWSHWLFAAPLLLVDVMALVGLLIFSVARVEI